MYLGTDGDPNDPTVLVLRLFRISSDAFQGSVMGTLQLVTHWVWDTEHWLWLPLLGTSTLLDLSLNLTTAWAPFWASILWLLRAPRP